MRIRTLSITTAILGFLVGGSQALAAAGTIQVAVPFEFLIGEKVLPPATYILEPASGVGPSVLRIRPTEGDDRVMFSTDQMPDKADPKMLQLVFDTIGEKTYLTEVWGVTDSGRAVKHLVDGHALARAPEGSRRHVTATRIVDSRDKED